MGAEIILYDAPPKMAPRGPIGRPLAPEAQAAKDNPGKWTVLQDVHAARAHQYRKIGFKATCRNTHKVGGSVRGDVWLCWPADGDGGQS